MAIKSNAKLPEEDWNDKSIADNYARFRPAYAPIAATWLRDFYRAASGREQAAVAIDAGCGPGQMSLPLADFCDRVIGIDIAEEMLAEARQLSPRPNIEYLQGDVRALRDVYATTGAPPADLLVSGMAVHYFDCDDFYDGARTVVRPGGVIAHFGYYFPGFNQPGLENLIDELFDRSEIEERLDHREKLRNGYHSLVIPFPEQQYRSEEIIVDMTRQDVRNFLITMMPVLEDGERNVQEFMEKDLPPGDQFGLRLPIFGRMAQLP